MDREEREVIRRQAAALGSDGCTGVSDLYRDCCYAHDIAYRTGRNHHGDPVTRAEADTAFRLCIQGESLFGKESLVAWARWAGVRLFGRGIWRDNEKRRLRVARIEQQLRRSRARKAETETKVAT